MAGPNININFGPPRRRRRRRAAGGGVLVLLVLAIIGYVKMGKPAPAVPVVRLPAAETALSRIRSLDLGKDLKQIPATVIDKGPLRHVPYVSHRAGDLEVNVYGDPDAPACIEIGLFAADPKRRAAGRDALAGLLPVPEDGDVLRTLDLAKGKSTRAGLTFEITPETAPDAYGGWWASVYDAKALEGARATEADLKNVSGPRPADASKSRPGGSTYVPGYYRKDGTYVEGYQKKAK